MERINKAQEKSKGTTKEILLLFKTPIRQEDGKR